MTTYGIAVQEPCQDDCQLYSASVCGVGMTQMLLCSITEYQNKYLIPATATLGTTTALYNRCFVTQRSTLTNNDIIPTFPCTMKYGTHYKNKQCDGPCSTWYAKCGTSVTYAGYCHVHTSAEASAIMTVRATSNAPAGTATSQAPGAVTSSKPSLPAGPSNNQLAAPISSNKPPTASDSNVASTTTFYLEQCRANDPKIAGLVYDCPSPETIYGNDVRNNPCQGRCTSKIASCNGRLTAAGYCLGQSMADYIATTMFNAEALTWTDSSNFPITFSYVQCPSPTVPDDQNSGGVVTPVRCPVYITKTQFGKNIRNQYCQGMCRPYKVECAQTETHGNFCQQYSTGIASQFIEETLGQFKVKSVAFYEQCRNATLIPGDQLAVDRILTAETCPDPIHYTEYGLDLKNADCQGPCNWWKVACNTTSTWAAYCSAREGVVASRTIENYFYKTMSLAQCNHPTSTYSEVITASECPLPSFYEHKNYIPTPTWDAFVAMDQTSFTSTSVIIGSSIGAAVIVGLFAASWIYISRRLRRQRIHQSTNME